MPTAKTLQEYPNNIFMWDFSGDTYITPPIFCIEEIGFKSTLLDADIRIHAIEPTSISLYVEYNEVIEEIICDNKGLYSSANKQLILKDGRREIDLVEYFNRNPLWFRTSDDALIIGNELNEGDVNAIVYDQTNILDIDWKLHKTNIREEVKGTNSIQSTLRKILTANNAYNYIIFDHSSGEIADFITVQEMSNAIEVSFYHVKGMSAANYNSSVSDVYEVAGQAVKSLIWLKNKQTLINKIGQRRKSGKCVFEIGKHNDFLLTMKQHKPLIGRIVVVQPSICKSIAMPDKIQEVLGASRYYIMNSGSAAYFEIWGSKL